jgi:hypothetical protein
LSIKPKEQRLRMPLPPWDMSRPVKRLRFNNNLRLPIRIRISLRKEKRR